MRPTGGLVRLLMTAQVLVIAVGALTLAATTGLVAPAVFRDHLARTGEASAAVRSHAEQAFASSFAISLTVATFASLVTAGLVSWVLLRRVARPVEQLADAADAVASGHYDVQVPGVAFGSELTRLTEAFRHMATRLADTEATRSKLLSDLAHELRTPLATLTAYVDGMEDGVVEIDPAAWETIRGQVGRLRRLANDVREVAAAEDASLELRMASTDPVALAKEAVATAGPAFDQREVRLSYDGPPSAPAVTADADRLGQVLANLLDNALRHTPTGGHVALLVRTDPGHVVVSVRDDGAGLATSDLDAVFARFYRVDPARGGSDGGGSGLGLSIARAIARAHGGDLRAASDGLGLGSTFTLRLPTRPGA